MRRSRFPDLSAPYSAGKRARGVAVEVGTSFEFWCSQKILDQLNDRALELAGAGGLGGFAEDATIELCTVGSGAQIATTLRSTPSSCCSTKRPRAWGTRTSDGSCADQEGRGQSTVPMVEHNMNVVRSLRRDSPCCSVDRSSPRGRTRRCRGPARARSVRGTADEQRGRSRTDGFGRDRFLRVSDLDAFYGELDARDGMDIRSIVASGVAAGRNGAGRMMTRRVISA